MKKRGIVFWLIAGALVFIAWPNPGGFGTTMGDYLGRLGHMLTEGMTRLAAFLSGISG